MSGSGKDDGEIQYSKEETKLNVGDIVYTSGSGALFKSGIPIGKIKNNTNVNFFSDFTQLKFVKVLNYEKESN